MDEIVPTQIQPTIRATFDPERQPYMVIVAGGQAPTRKHWSRYRAVAEAERLAALHPGREVHVVKLKKSVKASNDVAVKQHMWSLQSHQFVKVRDTHHQHAGEVGRVIALDLTRSMVSVSIMGRQYWFSAVSLIPLDPALNSGEMISAADLCDCAV